MADAGHSGADLPGGASSNGRGYRVLARKYRPTSFEDLIGQEAMVRTVSNAFETGRIPQAWILTGVRGVGKTTTARILARALNYELPDGSVTGPTIQMPTLGVHCQAIMESRHIDVLEMDAASHTGIDDVRQITDGVRYAPSNARYKVYIIDEVHMLSEKAFNAFLKTLEEPPEHAKFVFATTEIRKVPVTVLSRCQRFDLRRVDADVLMTHLGNIAAKEQVQIEPEALAVIARAAEGSVRDSLSLLDQAIAHAAGTVQANDVRQMLGLADRTRVIELFDALARGDIASAFKEFRDQYDIGADPVVVLSDLAEFVNFITRIKVVPATADNLALGETERVRGRDFATKLSMRVLSRMWQMLLKGIAEVQAATRPQAAAEMVLVRIAYVADLPTPDEAIRLIEQGGGGSARNGVGAARGTSGLVSAGGVSAQSTVVASSSAAAPYVSSPTGMAPRAMASGADSSLHPQMLAPTPAAQEAPSIVLRTFKDVVAFVAKYDIQLQKTLERDVRFVRMEDGRLEIALEASAPRSLPHDLQRKLEQWTARRWMVAVSNAEGEPTLRAQSDALRNERERTAEADPRIQEVLAKFPGARIVDVRHTPIAQVSNADGEEAEEPFESESDD